MPRQPLRGLTAALVALTGCGSLEVEGDLARGLRWLEDPVLRRDVLEASLVAPDNGYSQLRLTNYTEEGWGARPAWRPRVATASTSTAPASAFAPAIPEAFEGEEALIAVGAQAFARYPVQVVPELAAVLPEAAACGLEVDDAGVVEGVVWVELPDGPQPALTCAACHAGGDGAGRANAAFDLGAVLAGDCGRPSRWGPGRVDVTPDGVDNPTAIPDLRPVRLQAYLQRAGTVVNGRLELAARTETLIITSLSSSVRPPRMVALGLSWWMWTLADGLASPPPNREAQTLFTTHCARCHGREGGGGNLVPLDQAGTDRAVLESPSRATGFARVPALAGLADRGLLFSGGAAADFEAWWGSAARVEGHFDPAELGAEARQVLGDHLRAFGTRPE